MPRTLSLRPEVTFDRNGIRSRYDDGFSMFLAWKEISKVQLLSIRPTRCIRGRFFLFWGSEDGTVLIAYDQAPLLMLRESNVLPGFDVGEALNLFGGLEYGLPVTCWERSDQGRSGAD